MFADAAEGEVNTFMHLCMVKGIFVVTPHRIYDFQNLSCCLVSEKLCHVAKRVILAKC